MPRTQSPSTDAPPPQAQLRLRVNVGDASAIGPGKVELLEAIDRHRSISAAAKALGMSYRRAWLLIDEMNRLLKQPAITAAAGGSNGGGAELTDTGRQLVQLYRDIEARAFEQCRDGLARLLDLVAR
ncbi:MAG: ModE family transcriptional regulator [Roseateles depolymerans]|uniref:ModE family transcriptional regulator n=1 Tax=Roseateles depolymerans TaxID=76731 RepID=A0A2W5DUX2_9BURK|nr:MAG: ModE family transcriptional regulator [Roseateles depolymerans]